MTKKPVTFKNEEWNKLTEKIRNVAKYQCDDKYSRIEICIGCLNRFILDNYIKIKENHDQET